MGKLVAEIGGNVRIIGVPYQRVEVALAPGPYFKIAEIDQHHSPMLRHRRLRRQVLPCRVEGETAGRRGLKIRDYSATGNLSLSTSHWPRSNASVVPKMLKETSAAVRTSSRFDICPWPGMTFTSGGRRGMTRSQAAIMPCTLPPAVTSMKGNP